MRLLLASLVVVKMMAACTPSDNLSKVNVNKFRMEVDGENWYPSVIDPCNQTFQSNMSTQNQKNYYDIFAYRDSSLVANLNSRNFFEMRIMNVDTKGDYFLDSVFHISSNYARFTVNESGHRTVYQNTNDKPFKVTISELFPSASSSLVGIAGSFQGVLYNIKNSADSIVVTNGSFVFNKTNCYCFNQCEE